MERTKEILGTNREDGEKKAAKKKNIERRIFRTRLANFEFFTFSSLYGVASFPSPRLVSFYRFFFPLSSYRVFAARYYRLIAVDDRAESIECVLCNIFSACILLLLWLNMRIFHQKIFKKRNVFFCCRYCFDTSKFKQLLQTSMLCRLFKSIFSIVDISQHNNNFFK